MISIVDWFINNWEMIIPIGILIVVLSLTGNITQTVRTAKKGLKEAVTPLGFIVFCVLIYACYLVYLNILATI